MKSGKLFSGIVGIILLTVISTVFVSQPAAEKPTVIDDSIPPSIEQSILDATVQIYLYPEHREPGTSIFERGLGTLISLNGEYLVYTHDHWGFLVNPGRAEFRNAQGETLLQVNGAQFKTLICYRDGGSMILSAPVELWPEYLVSQAKSLRPLAAASLENARGVTSGDTVLVARRNRANPEIVELLTEQVEAKSNWNGNPAYRLRSLNGEVIVPGDSGGGIWRNEKLVGNMWISERVIDWRIWKWDSPEPARKFLDTSIAAALPAQLINLASQPPVTATAVHKRRTGNVED